MTVQEAFRRAPWSVAKISRRPFGLAPSLAAGLRAARQAAKYAHDRLAAPSIAARVSDARKWGTLSEVYRALNAIVAKRRLSARETSGPSLWVWLRPGVSPCRVPSLRTVARMRRAAPTEWAVFTRRYGLLISRPLVVADLWHIETTSGKEPRAEAYPQAPVPVPRGPDHFRLVRIPLTALEHFADKASTLERSLVESVTGDLATRLAPQRAAAEALREALNDFEPWAITLPRARGLTDEWAFYAQGAWPLIVLDSVAARWRTGTFALCAAEACSNAVPPGRDKYCSDQCVWREKQRRYRARKKAEAQSGVATRARSRSRARG
jgi:hypothetical protein